jgi:hypothetical protein
VVFFAEVDGFSYDAVFAVFDVSYNARFVVFLKFKFHNIAHGNRICSPEHIQTKFASDFTINSLFPDTDNVIAAGGFYDQTFH